LERNILITKDGSHTIAVAGTGLTYHSLHGAVQESRHVFIREGLQYYLQQHPDTDRLQLFEMGLGTGLNALLTLQEAEAMQLPVEYTAVELNPLTTAEIQLLNYGGLLNLEEAMQGLHSAPWSQPVPLSAYFTLTKVQVSLPDYRPAERFHVVFYDAFAPLAQPELWAEAIFRQLYDCLLPGGVLVTYCSKSIVRRAMQAAGFTVQKVPGPPGKREMLRATRPDCQ
jgi:tRNA U34 5-methylaminomethyl-2-thiouridine-forming methyltransferase MnmC